MVLSWNIIKEVKEAVNVPVVGNGDITKPEDVKERLEETGVDYVAIGRAASGNPLLFSKINEFMSTGTYEEITSDERLEIFHEYIEVCGLFRWRSRLPLPNWLCD